MKRAALFPLVFALSFCAGGRGPSDTSVAGHGALNISIAPNPIVASRVSGTTFDFPFEVVLRETGGHAVDINRVSANVLALGGIQVATESYDAAQIRALGYGTRVAANGELRYRFNPRRDVTNELLFQGVSADIRVEGTDDTGAPTTAGTRVTVTKN